MRSPQEIIFRLRQEAGNLARLIRTPHARSAITSPLLGLPDAAAPDAAAVERLANRILQHKFPLLGFEIETGPKIDWRRDYVNGKSTGLDYFRRIPYLDFERAGDHKPIWELNRHQHLVLLARAWRLTGRVEFCREIEAELESWWADNPYGRGINWTSALEVGFRALSWIWVYHIAGEQLNPRTRERLLDSLYVHGRHLEGNLSVYFSPNTHLLGEAVALHAIGVLFPDFPRSQCWRRKGGDLVRAQMDAQVRADGSHFEQSTYYHVYALDMLTFSALLEEMPPAYMAKLRRMEDYLDALLGPQRRLPFLGDDDGGRFDPFGVASQTEGAPTKGGSRLFEDAGIAVMQAGDTQLIADAGPFGPGGAGHSHADTLSFVLRRGDEDLLIDAGTFTYVGDARWRKWFRGTAAHNTIRIDGMDQATPVGPFRWADKPEVKINEWRTDSEEDLLDAACRYRGFEHRRRILFAKPHYVFILDEVGQAILPADPLSSGSSRLKGGCRQDCLPHNFEQLWHSGAEVTQESPRRFQLGRAARLLLSQNASLEVGGENGWRSRVFGSKEPAPVICAMQNQELPAVFAAVIDLTSEVESFQLAGNGDAFALDIKGGYAGLYSLKRQ